MTALQSHHTTPHAGAHQATARPSAPRIIAGGVIGAVAGAALLSGYGGVALAIHGPMYAGDLGSATASPITAASFAIGVLFSTFLGTLLALTVARWAADPARAFLRSALALLLLSLAFPLTASHTTEATRLVLAAGHLLAAVVVIPVLLRTFRPRVA